MGMQKFQLNLIRPEAGNLWPWFSVDLGYTRISFHPRIEISSDGPSVCVMDVSDHAFFIREEDQGPLYQILLDNEFMMKTFFQVVVLQSPDYAYPKSIFQEIARLPLTDREAAIVNKHLSGFTCIYLIRDTGTGLTKIGRADNPEQRLKQLIKQDTLLPTPNNFILLRAWDDYPYMEKILHSEFAEKRVRGEWFDLNDEDVKAALKTCCIYD